MTKIRDNINIPQKGGIRNLLIGLLTLSSLLFILIASVLISHFVTDERLQGVVYLGVLGVIGFCAFGIYTDVIESDENEEYLRKILQVKRELYNKWEEKDKRCK